MTNKEIRLEIVKITYRHDIDTLDKAEKLYQFVMKEQEHVSVKPVPVEPAKPNVINKRKVKNGINS